MPSSNVIFEKKFSYFTIADMVDIQDESVEYRANDSQESSSKWYSNALEKFECLRCYGSYHHFDIVCEPFKRLCVSKMHTFFAFHGADYVLYGDMLELSKGAMY